MQLITDRTEADVLLGHPKGQYSFADLNRVEQAVAQLQQLAEQLDIKPAITVKTDWGLPGTFSGSAWPTQGQMTRYLGNVHTLCSALEVAANLPDTMIGLTWQGANAIEQALLDAHTRVMSVLAALYYSGEIFAGEEFCL